MIHANNFRVAEKLRDIYLSILSLALRSFSRGIPKPSEKMKTKFQAILGIEGYARSGLYSSDLKAREFAALLMVKLLSKMWGRAYERATRGKRPTHFAFVTFIHREWNCSDRDTAFNMMAVRNKASKAIRDAGLNGVCVIEIQGLTNYPEHGKGKTLMPNVHGIVWSRTPIDMVGWRKTINGSPSWPTDFGCPALHVVELQEDTLEDRTNIERTVLYMMKPPHDAKYFKPQKGKPGYYKFASTTEAYPPILALRLVECLSHLSMLDMVFGVGKDGVKWCNRWRSGLKAWQKKRFETDALRDVDPVKFWAKYRKKSKTEKFKPVRLLKGSERGEGIVYRGGEGDPARPKTDDDGVEAPRRKRRPVTTARETRLEAARRRKQAKAQKKGQKKKRFRVGPRPRRSVVGF
jgi:hypothetical protein